MPESNTFDCAPLHRKISELKNSNSAKQRIRLCNKIEKLEAENTELREALRWFCNRVDAGEVRNKKTYERFKELLDKYE